MTRRAAAQAVVVIIAVPVMDFGRRRDLLLRIIVRRV